MGGSTNKGDLSVMLGGHEFMRVKNGLDEAEVASFINELINQRDTMARTHEHISSLGKLAENTVIEADRMGKEILKNAAEQAKAEADAVVAEAKRQGQQIGEKERAGIVASANEQAIAIKAEAEQKAEILIESERIRIQNELSEFLRQISSQLLSQFETIKEQVAALQPKNAQMLSLSEEDTATTIGSTGDDTDDLSKLIGATDETNGGAPDWELEIMPPINIMKVMDAMAQLGQLPAVERTEIIPMAPGKPSIMVYLREPMELLETLRTMPNVVQITEDSTSVAGDNAKPKKVKIVLSEATDVGHKDNDIARTTSWPAS